MCVMSYEWVCNVCVCVSLSWSCSCTSSTHKTWRCRCVCVCVCVMCVMSGCLMCVCVCVSLSWSCSCTSSTHKTWRCRCVCVCVCVCNVCVCFEWVCNVCVCLCLCPWAGHAAAQAMNWLRMDIGKMSCRLLACFNSTNFICRDEWECFWCEA